MRALLPSCLVAVTWVTAATADPIIFSGLGTDRPFNAVRSGGSAPIGVVTFDAVTTVSAIGVYDATAATGTHTFFIFDYNTRALLYQSASKLFAGDGGTTINLDSFKVSDPFSCTFQPGVTYEIGATSTVTTGYFAAFDAVSQNGITLKAGNDNVTGAAVQGNSACCSTGIELFGTVAATATAVPEPASLALLGMGVVGVAAALRRRLV